jgi:hypothetical protein
LVGELNGVPQDATKLIAVYQSPFTQQNTPYDEGKDVIMGKKDNKSKKRSHSWLSINPASTGEAGVQGRHLVTVKFKGESFLYTKVQGLTVLSLSDRMAGFF